MEGKNMLSGSTLAAVLVLAVVGGPVSGQDELRRAREHYEWAQAEGISTAERIRWLRESIAVVPTYRAWLELGDVHRSLGAWEEAIASFKTAFELAAGDEYRARAASRVGSVYADQDRYVEARSWLRRSLSYHPDDGVRRALRELELSRRGRVVRAEEILEELAVHRSFGVEKAELRIHFELNRAALNELGRAQARELGKALSRRDRGWFLLLGHTDQQCPPPREDEAACDRFNLDLSDRRAAAVREFLISELGLPASRLDAAGCGREHLLSPDSSEDDHYLNRRVVVLVLDQPAVSPQRFCADETSLL